MKKTLRGMTIGFLIGTMSIGTVAYAKSTTEDITVRYDNIKVYKDNVLYELKDSNGTKIEPFIYNGTTYLPLRSTADLAGLDVTWDGATKSVYLWGEMSAADTYLMEVCPPYDLVRFKTVLRNNGETMEMSGEKYSNGLHGYSTYVNSQDRYALFNLNGKYAYMDVTIGHTDHYGNDKTITFIVDGKVIEEIELPAESLPKTVSIPLNYGLQLKITGSTGEFGLADIIVR